MTDKEQLKTIKYGLKEFDEVLEEYDFFEQSEVYKKSKRGYEFLCSLMRIANIAYSLELKDWQINKLAMFLLPSITGIGNERKSRAEQNKDYRRT